MRRDISIPRELGASGAAGYLDLGEAQVVGGRDLQVQAGSGDDADTAPRPLD